MKDFYVQLTSNASTTEFPANTAHHFKNRMPYPLQFREPGWKVGLASLLYPTPPSRPHQSHTFEADDLICRFKWTSESLDIRGDVKVNNWTFNLTGRQLIEDKALITGGRALMKYIINRYMSEVRRLVTDKGDSLVPSEGDKFYLVFKWEGDDLIIDNSNTFLSEAGGRNRPEVLFGAKLVEAMQWIGKDQYGFYLTNGNLRTEADATPDNVKRDWAHIDQYRTWTDFWSFSAEGLQLSPYTNWRFVYLDEAYQKAFGGSSTTPHRSPMYVYSNAGQSMVMGNQVTDLMREIPHDPDRTTYEPRHILYLPVRVDVMDILETQVAENDGTLVDFVPGVTTLTLHFKYE